MWGNKQKVQFFLARLLVLLAGLPRFCSVIDLTVGLTVGLAIGGAESMGGKITDGFSRWFLKNELISFLRCYIAKTGSQVFSFLR